MQKSTTQTTDDARALALVTLAALRDTAIINDMVHDAIAPCPYCDNDGHLCWECGALDTPSIGRKLVYLMHNDRPTLLRILCETQRRFWPLLARAYIAELGVSEDGRTVPAVGVVGLWGMLVREAGTRP